MEGRLLCERNVTIEGATMFKEIDEQHCVTEVFQIGKADLL